MPTKKVIDAKFLHDKCMLRFNSTMEDPFPQIEEYKH